MKEPFYPQELDQVLLHDPNREASDTLRGFDWQRWLTLLTWIDLEGAQTLWIERGEDFTVVGPDTQISTTQAKSSSSSITLGTKASLKLIEDAFSRSPVVQTVIWTRGSPGKELTSPFADGAIAEWIRFQDNRVEGSALRNFLLSSEVASANLKSIVREADSPEKFAALAARVRWITGEGDIAYLKARAVSALESRLGGLDVQAPTLKSEQLCNLLFEEVGRVATLENRSERKLDRRGFDLWIAEQLRMIVDASVVEKFHSVLHKLGGPRRYSAFTDQETATPFSLPWYVYTERSIPLVGREAELLRLRDFVNDERPLLLQLLGGDAGSGKSRLAMEFMNSLDGKWRRGFVEKKDLTGLEGEFALAGSQLFIALDYAGTAADALCDFLERASEAVARFKIKLRLLLIEREVGPGIEWREAISSSLRPASAIFHKGSFGDPIVLRSLAGKDDQVLRSWLLSGGNSTAVFDDVPEPRRKEMLILCDENPLLLGFAAAALVAGDIAFESVTELLDGLLRRQLSSGNSFGHSDAHLEAVLGLCAVATAARYEINGPHDSDVFYESRDGRLGAFVVTGKDETKRFLTVGEIRRSKDFPEKLEFLNSNARTKTRLIGETFPSERARDLVRAAQKLFGPSCILYPDLMGEYLLAMHWRPLDAFLKAPIGGTDDEQFDRELRLAYHFLPFGLFTTLSMLRERSWAADAYLRAVSKLAFIAVESEEIFSRSWRLEFARLIFNSTVRIAGKKPTVRATELLVASLECLANRWPEDVQIRTRFLKAQSTLLKRDGSFSRPDVVLDWLMRARGLEMAEDEKLDEGFCEAYAQSLFQALYLLRGNKSAAPTIINLIRTFAVLSLTRPTPAVLEVMAQAFYAVSTDLVGASELAFPDIQHASFAEAILAECAREFCGLLHHHREKLAPEDIIAMLKTLGNCNFASAKLMNVEAATYFYEHIKLDWDVGEALESKIHAEILALSNIAMVTFQKEQISKLGAVCQQAGERCGSLAGSSKIVTQAYLRLLRIAARYLAEHDLWDEYVQVVKQALSLELEPTEPDILELFTTFADGLKDDIQRLIELSKTTSEAFLSELGCAEDRLTIRISKAAWL